MRKGTQYPLTTVRFEFRTGNINRPAMESKRDKGSKTVLKIKEIDIKTIDMIRETAKHSFDKACKQAEENMAMNDFFNTWARHCGAPKDVFIGHTVRMLIDIDNRVDK